MDNVIEILKARHLFEAMTDPALETALRKPVTLYAGFDPSAPSLQVGNLATIMALAHFQQCGHRVIAVVGGGTGLIGDPSGKSAERALPDVETARRNVEGIRENLSRFLGQPAAPARIVDNHDWLGNFAFIEFLRDVGKHFRMGAMLGRESVRARLAGEAGMSFAEFSYPLLQACDFLKLFDAEQCVLQIGGADQWGNITAGIDLIGRLRNAVAYGLTLPLVCDSSGQKLGKSEGNAVYLDAARTPPYDFYQFFLRTEDVDVVRLLKIFTLLPLEAIHDLEACVREQPEKRDAQRRLADEVTRLVHGEDGLRAARIASSVLFGESMEGLRAEDLLRVFADVPSRTLSRAEVEGRSVVDVAAASGLCASKGEARRLIESRGLYLNNRRVETPRTRVALSDLLDGRLLVFRSGKKTFVLVEVS
ncbi:MAG: tyrosine--tRNA ligase [Verrucomicrobiota bacterium]|nr:tyrosine--tRNA ligase [Verrucomicrobiota bacterium]